MVLLILTLARLMLAAIFTTEGKEWATDKVQSVAPASNALMDQIAWGTGASAEAVGNTFAGAFTEAAPTSTTRITGTLSQPTTTTDRLVGTVTATSSLNITEVARTNVATPGATGQKMYMRALFTSVPVQSADSIAFTLDVVFT